MLRRWITEVKETAASRPGTARGTEGAESNRAMFDFRSDRAAKTNRRTLCGRFVAIAIIVDVRQPIVRSIESFRLDFLR